MEEPTDNHLFGGHSESGDYGGFFPAGTFGQEQEQDQMSALFSRPETQSPPPSLPWQSPPPAEGFAGTENFGDGAIPPLDGMPCIPFCDGGLIISPLDKRLPCIPAAVADEETNYAPAPPAPLVATHGTEPGQLSYKFPPSSTMFDEEELQHEMMSLQRLLHAPMALDGSSNTNGGPAARSHADTVTVVQQGSTTADGLPHSQQQSPLPTNGPEAQPGGGRVCLDLSRVDEVQPPSPTPVINPSPDEANHAASAPMGSQGIIFEGLPSGIQDGSDNLFAMGIDMIRQLGRHIGKMRKDEEHRSKVWQHFWKSQCKYCHTLNVICQHCNTVMRNRSTIELLRHLESCEFPDSSGVSKEIQRSSQALQIKEIAENPNGESEPTETDNSNCATAARVDTQGTNAVVLSPLQQHQLLMHHEEQMATILSPQPCCQGPNEPPWRPDELRWHVGLTKYIALVERGSWWDLTIRLSESSCCSSTTKSTHDGFRLKFSNNKEKDGTRVRVLSSAAWMHVSENPYKDQDGAEVKLATGSYIIGSSYLLMVVAFNDWMSIPVGCAYPWRCMYLVLRSLGFRKEFATNFVIYALAWVNGCTLMPMIPSSSDKGKSIIIVEQGDDDVPSAKRKRKPSQVWNHFTKVVVEAEDGSKATMAECNYCRPSKLLQADSKRHGTTHLRRHIIGQHREHAKSLLDEAQDGNC